MENNKQSLYIKSVQEHPYLFLLLACLYFEGCILLKKVIPTAFLLGTFICIVIVPLVYIIIQSILLKRRKVKISAKINDFPLVAFFILLFGFVFRMVYTFCTGIYVRQHDVGKVTNEGHIGYILYIFQFHTIPDFDIRDHYQFYHPPLHHAIAALWYGINRFLGVSNSDSLKSIQVLTLFYSGCILILSYRIFRELKLKGISLYISCLVVAFHPTLIYFSGSINNDELSMLFVLLAILYTIRWFNKPSLKEILMIAVGIGCGMMTKLSAGFIAFPIAAVFFLKLCQQRKLQKMLLLIRDFCFFGLVVFPLGLWFPIKNYILFHIPFNYVFDISPTSDQYIGSYNILPRFFDFSLHQFKDLTIQGLKNGNYLEHNIGIALLKSLVFGEWAYIKLHSITTLIGNSVFWINVILIILIFISCIAFFYNLFFGKRQSDIFESIPWIFLFITIVIYLIMQMLFCVEYPYICTQDARYIAVLIPPAAAFLSILPGQFKQNKGNLVAIFIFSSTVLFSLLSFAMFAFILFLN